MSAGGGRGGHGGRKHRGGDHEEQHENHERWLVSYADMMTLLMVLFIVMFAISQVDQRKFAQLKNGLAVGFGEQSAAFSGSPGTLDDNGQAPAPLSLSPQVEVKTKTQEQQKYEKAAVAAADRARGDANMKAAEEEVARLQAVKKAIFEALKRLGQQKSVQFRIDERGLVVSIVTSEVVFHGDQADLLPGGQRVLNVIGPVLRPLPNAIEVDGHTNHLGVANPQYPTSWELSTARASRVVRYFVDNHFLAAKRLTAAGFGAERPLYPVNDPRAITLNRRVDIIVLSGLPSEQRALLPTAAGEGRGRTVAATASTTNHD